MRNSVTITRSTFAGNTASQRGAAINAHTESQVVVLNSTFSDNAALSGSVLNVGRRTAAAVVFTTFADQQRRAGAVSLPD
jgi:predicted outer membrane repeat protein